jgi:hypothetical protein
MNLPANPARPHTHQREKNTRSRHHFRRSRKELRHLTQASNVFADFTLTRIVKAKNLNKAIPEAQQIEADAQWVRIVRLEMVPHPGLEHPKAVEADFRMEKGMFSIDMRAPLVGYALRRWSVDCTTDHSLDCKEHHLWLRNHQTLYGVESAALGPGYVNLGATNGPL